MTDDTMTEGHMPRCCDKDTCPTLLADLALLRGRLGDAAAIERDRSGVFFQFPGSWNGEQVAVLQAEVARRDRATALADAMDAAKLKGWVSRMCCGGVEARFEGMAQMEAFLRAAAGGRPDRDRQYRMSGEADGQAPAWEYRLSVSLSLLRYHDRDFVEELDAAGDEEGGDWDWDACPTVRIPAADVEAVIGCLLGAAPVAAVLPLTV